MAETKANFNQMLTIEELVIIVPAFRLSAYAYRSC